MQHPQLTLRPGRMHQLPNFEQPERRVIIMSFQLGVYRTGDLRALLEDEDKINHFIRCSEKLLFKRLAERKIQVADFLDSFLTLRKLQHVRLIVVKKLKEMIRHGEKTRQRLREIHPEAQDFSVAFPQRIHHPCEPVCSLSTAVVLPPCCHRLFLPLGDHGNTARYLPLFPLCLDSDDESVCPGVYGRGPKRLTVPVRLQPLKVKQKRHRQAPP
ncbi:hypothetical protein F2P81_016798 [Scophthalmus maximus]|uniref:Uncharacterized protein n=1 Tax=Scophthalmus maximus TaxID=52904 RepID=A0A6A4SA52_SCOMX|nr:hypothetical protein F2P81_016798 [Scophthalmus maximus]